VSAFYALKDTRTPARIAFLRVIIAGAVGYGLMKYLENYQIQGRPLGVLGLSLSAAVGAWVEWAFLRRTLGRRIGHVGATAGTLARMTAAAATGAIAGRGLLFVLPDLHPVMLAAVTVPAFAAVYFLTARALGVQQAALIMDRYLRRLRR
jgi:putative peptidoglycan lipid II flippase